MVFTFLLSLDGEHQFQYVGQRVLTWGTEILVCTFMKRSMYKWCYCLKKYNFSQSKHLLTELNKWIEKQAVFVFLSPLPSKKENCFWEILALNWCVCLIAETRICLCENWEVSRERYNWREVEWFCKSTLEQEGWVCSYWLHRHMEQTLVVEISTNFSLSLVACP